MNTHNTPLARPPIWTLLPRTQGQHATLGLIKWSALLLTAWASACNGELAVIDDEPGAGVGGSQQQDPTSPDPDSNPPSSPPQPSDEPCGCASSDALTALVCNPRLTTVTSSGDRAHLTATGDVVAFTLCVAGTTAPDCPVFHWTETTGTRELLEATLHGMSANGSTLVVSSLSEGARLIQPAGPTSSVGISPITRDALSPDGTFVVGTNAPASANEFLLGRWSLSGGFEQFGTLPLGQRGGISDSTPDGSVLVGGWGPAPFRATATGLTDLGPLPQGATDAAALAVSDDGNVIAGVTGGLGGVFRWTAAGGMVQVAAGGPDVWPRVNLSSDGAVLGGTRDEAGNLGPMAFRWTEAAGAVALTPGSESRTLLMDAGGRVMVGQTVQGAAPTGLFVWDAANGSRPLRGALEDAGVDLTGWEFGDEPGALSADGRVLVGEGTCGGVLTTYRMVLPD